MKVALLGPKGTYTHQAADRYFEDLEPVFYSSIREVFKAEESTKFVPIENSLGGGVTDTLDLLREQDQNITGEQVMQIEHCILSKEDNIESIKTIRSHPQALSQCKSIIEEKDWKKKEESSTAEAAKNLNEGEAAIASKVAAKIYDLNVLGESVQDTEKNVTRFFVLNGGEDKTGEKTSLILEPGEDRPGLLANMLSCFSGHQINLSHIQSRPTRNELGEYYFYIEAEAGKHEKRFQKAAKCLKTYSNISIKGSYNVER